MGIFDFLFGNKKNSETKPRVDRKTSKSKNKDSKDFYSPWIDVVNNRVQLMPLNSEGTELSTKCYGRSGIGVKELGVMHYGEYLTNESKIPEFKRREVAINRLDGLLSIKDYFQSQGNKQQKFHFEASLIGAEMFADSKGIDVNNSKSELKSSILAQMELNQRYAIFCVLINIANCDGVSDEEHDVLAYILDELEIIPNDYNESQIDGNQACDLLQGLNEEQKKRISELIAFIVGADNKLTSSEMMWVNDVIMQLDLDDRLLVDLAEKYSKE